MHGRSDLRRHSVHSSRLAAAGRAVQQQAARPAHPQRGALGAVALRPGKHLRAGRGEGQRQPVWLPPARPPAVGQPWSAVLAARPSVPLPQKNTPSLVSATRQLHSSPLAGRPALAASLPARCRPEGHGAADQGCPRHHCCAPLHHRLPTLSLPATPTAPPWLGAPVLCQH